MLSMLRRPGALALLLGAMVAAPAAAQRPIKVFISIDMEGITGVATDGQLGPDPSNGERFRGFMTAEALAAIEGYAKWRRAPRSSSWPTRMATCRTC
ncbi:MAG: M55 family metallopeptidase [Gemmatimonadales bacterium]